MPVTKYVCEDCDAVFFDESKMEKHQKLHIKNGKKIKVTKVERDIKDVKSFYKKRLASGFFDRTVKTSSGVPFTLENLVLCGVFAGLEYATFKDKSSDTGLVMVSGYENVGLTCDQLKELAVNRARTIAEKTETINRARTVNSIKKTAYEK